jgi:hypothetical protein
MAIAFPLRMQAGAATTGCECDANVSHNPWHPIRFHGIRASPLIWGKAPAQHWNSPCGLHAYFEKSDINASEL